MPAPRTDVPLDSQERGSLMARAVVRRSSDSTERGFELASGLFLLLAGAFLAYTVYFVLPKPAGPNGTTWVAVGLAGVVAVLGVVILVRSQRSRRPSSAAFLDILKWCDHQLTLASDVPRVVTVVVEGLRGLLDSRERAALYLGDEDAMRLAGATTTEVMAATVASLSLAELPQRQRTGLALGEPIEASGSAVAVLARRLHLSAESRWAYVVPVSHHNGVLGLIVVHAPAEMVAERFSAITALASSAALALRSVQPARTPDDVAREALVRQMPDVWLVVSTDGSIEYASDAAQLVFGTAAVELTGRSILDLVAAADAPELIRALAQTSSDRAQVHLDTIEVRSATGVSVARSLTTRPFTMANDQPGILAVLRDRAEVGTLRDPLTGLATLELFHDRLQHGLDRTREQGTAMTLLLASVDRYEDVTTGWNAQQRRTLLGQLASRATPALSESDTLAIVSNSTLAVVREGPGSSLHRAQSLAAMLVQLLSGDYHVAGKSVSVTMSAGGAVTVGSWPAERDFFHLAERSLNSVQQRGGGGGGGSEVFATLATSAVHGAPTSGLHLAEVVQDHQFKIVYQPVVNAKTQRIDHVEALVRLFDPETGMHQPVEFLPVIEDSGLAHAFGRWLLAEACSSAQYMGAVVGGETPFVSVNLSPLQFVAGDLVQVVASALEISGVAASDLQLELDAQRLTGAPDSVLRQLEQLHRMGIRLAIDHLAPGLLGNQALLTVPLGMVKLDRAFSEWALNSDGDAALACGLLAHGLGTGWRVVAVGVESKAEFDRVPLLGAELAQGFYIAHPLSLVDVCELLKRAHFDPSWFQQRLLVP